MIEKIFSFIIIFIVGILILLPINFNKYEIPPSLAYYYRILAPCSNPIYYKIGKIDPRFNVKVDDLISDTKIAADIWNKTQSQDLFIYDPTAPLAINLVYDERQSISTQIQTTENQLQTAKSQLSPTEQKYNVLVADFKSRLSVLNIKIQYWNSRGGAPPDEYQKLIAEQNSLKQEVNEINSLANQLNISAKEYNNLVNQFNQSAANFNEVIQNKPEEGLYSPSRNEIDIYVAVNKNELIHTLAHELGHTIGLLHTLDKKSIMFASSSTTTEITTEDKTIITNRCSPPKNK